MKHFVYEGLGFPVVLSDVFLVKKRGVWTPAIDYNKLQKEVLLALARKSAALTGSEIHFIRTYFEMTLASFGKLFGFEAESVLAWEETGEKLAKISPVVEQRICLLIIEKMGK
jgi:DNA-binding transcriptional regulator YiaG